jgi:hypothetical protein
MTLDPHMVVLAAVTLAVGYLMMLSGLQKSVLELRRRRRICPSCGREIKRGCACTSHT